MEYILSGLDGGILKIELNRPQKLNALTFLGSVTYYGSLLLFLVAFVLTVHRECTVFQLQNPDGTQVTFTQ